MKTWEENVRKVVPYVPGEQPKVQNLIKLNTNENPYPPSPKVAEALKAIDVDCMRLYPDPAASVLVKGIADFYQLQEDQVFVGVGSDDVLAMIFMTFFNSKNRSCSRISLTLFTMCGQICCGSRMRRFR